MPVVGGEIESGLHRAGRIRSGAASRASCDADTPWLKRLDTPTVARPAGAGARDAIGPSG